MERLPDEEPTEAEIAETERLEAARTGRIDGSPLATAARVVLTLTCDWLETYRARLAHADPALGEAIRIVSWDCRLIGAKLHRALHGRDAAPHGAYLDDDPVQNDRNGSA